MQLEELYENIKVIFNGKEYSPSVASITQDPMAFPELQLTVPIDDSRWFLPKQKYKYTPKRILKSGPCTIVFWQDGTKTMVRRAADEVDDDYSAFTAALAIKIFGSNSAVKSLVKRNIEFQKPKVKDKVVILEN